MVSNLEFERQRFAEGLRAAISTLEASGINYRVVGSVARYASTRRGEVFDPRQPQEYKRIAKPPSYLRGHITDLPLRDLDLILPVSVYTLGKIANPMIPFNIRNFPFMMDDSVSAKFIRWDDVRESVDLVHHRLSVPVSPETMAPVRAELFGVEFNTVDLRTLFHFTGIAGELRSEDRPEAMLMARKLNQGAQGYLPESLFREYHEYFKKKRQRYPLYAFWVHRRHQKETNSSDSIGGAYKRLPPFVKALQRATAQAAIWVEGQIR